MTLTPFSSQPVNDSDPFFPFFRGRSARCSPPSRSARRRPKVIVPQIRAGAVFVNAGGLAFDMPFGGYPQSGNGREFGKFGLGEFLEVKS